MTTTVSGTGSTNEGRKQFCIYMCQKEGSSYDVRAGCRAEHNRTWNQIKQDLTRKPGAHVVKIATLFHRLNPILIKTLTTFSP